MINKIVFTAAQAAQKLGVTRQALHYMVKAGKIKPASWIEGKHKYYEAEEINKYLDREDQNRGAERTDNIIH